MEGFTLYDLRGIVLIIFMIVALVAIVCITLITIDFKKKDK